MQWYKVRGGLVAWSSAGTVRIRSATFAPWMIKSEKLGYTILVGKNRIGWSEQLTTALEVADNFSNPRHIN